MNKACSVLKKIGAAVNISSQQLLLPKEEHLGKKLKHQELQDSNQHFSESSPLHALAVDL
jgi:hypothetical protein